MVTRPDQGLTLLWAYSGEPVLRAFFSRGWESQKREREKTGVCTFHSLNLVSHFPPSFSPLLTGKQLRIVEKCVLGWKMQQIKYDSIEKMKNQTIFSSTTPFTVSSESFNAQKVFACISKFHFQTPTALQRASFRVCVHIVHTPSQGTSSSSSPPERPWASRAGVSSWQHSFTQAATAGCNLHIPLKFDLCYRTPKGAVKRSSDTRTQMPCRDS